MTSQWINLQNITDFLDLLSEYQLDQLSEYQLIFMQFGYSIRYHVFKTSDINKRKSQGMALKENEHYWVLKNVLERS